MLPSSRTHCFLVQAQDDRSTCCMVKEPSGKRFPSEQPHLSLLYMRGSSCRGRRCERLGNGRSYSSEVTHHQLPKLEPRCTRKPSSSMEPGGFCWEFSESLVGRPHVNAPDQHQGLGGCFFVEHLRPSNAVRERPKNHLSCRQLIPVCPSAELRVVEIKYRNTGSALITPADRFFGFFFFFLKAVHTHTKIGNLITVG